MIITQSGGLNLPDRIAPARRSAIQRRLQLTYTLVLQDRPPNSGLAIAKSRLTLSAAHA
jgi:hypothetical protein